MGKQQVRLKAVCGTICPERSIKRSPRNWIGASLLLGPLIVTYNYVQRYQEKEKLEHRY